MRTYCLLVILLLIGAPAPHPVGRCGTERWAVKTLTDPAAGAVALTPIATTVATLRAIPAPAPLPVTRAPQELHAYQVHVVVLGWKREADQDLHIVIADAASPDRTMIVEIPSASCTLRTAPPLRDRIATARAAALLRFGTPTAAFKRLRPPVPATITGVGFFDLLHGQTGVAPNGIELHPVLGISFP